ncbi:hypothetical protein HIM_02358 [Hirsutella minnesotensis 3608]|nr:hypothetical protein HIM_02358 [Hirsutella minnesotensis 3608]
MATSFAQDIFQFFDVWEDCREFLCDLVDSGIAPQLEIQRLLSQISVAEAENWNDSVDYAKPNNQLCGQQPDGQDVLASLFDIVSGQDGPSEPSTHPLEETDSLITTLAKGPENDARGPLSSATESNVWQGASDSSLRRSMRKQRSAGAASHYWDLTRRLDADSDQPPVHNDGTALSSVFARTDRKLDLSQRRSQSHSRQVADTCTHGDHPPAFPWADATALCPSRSKTSPFFAAQKPSPKRPLPGTISCVPFPALSSARFGIIQEELAHDPFWLLIAVTFLIKTSGQLAIPALLKVRQQFPTPQHLADVRNEAELSDMIRHLGLVVVRVAYIRKYAKAFLNNPPQANKRYKVRNYDVRDMKLGIRAGSINLDGPDPNSNAVEHVPDDDFEAWEIGHMTQGKYALDSWRIFCRDRLLDRAQDYNGKGQKPEFQPEWMRVMPKDKELRAFLRWMWMREGWEWDPDTGERSVLRPEMQRAVNDGRVEYDERGGLRILDKPRETS